MFVIVTWILTEFPDTAVCPNVASMMPQGHSISLLPFAACRLTHVPCYAAGHTLQVRLCRLVNVGCAVLLPVLLHFKGSDGCGCLVRAGSDGGDARLPWICVNVLGTAKSINRICVPVSCVRFRGFFSRRTCCSGAGSGASGHGVDSDAVIITARLPVTRSILGNSRDHSQSVRRCRRAGLRLESLRVEDCESVAVRVTVRQRARPCCSPGWP
eukprot:1652233-Rhodomonas_salina.2